MNESTNLEMAVYVIIGTTEEVCQEQIGGPFVSSFHKEIVKIFKDRHRAENFIESQRLKKPIKKTFSGEKSFRGGYYDMEIEEFYVE